MLSMAEGLPTELNETNAERVSTADDMELESSDVVPNAGTSVDLEPKLAADGGSNSKRTREDSGKAGEDSDDVSKKQKVEKSVEEARLENVREGEEKSPGSVILGPKKFVSSAEMYGYFYKFLHYWTLNFNVNKYEHMVLLELLTKGHPEPEKKIGVGISAFQVWLHPEWKTRCFFLVRDDNTVDDFSFRKCVNNILPLPEDMKVSPKDNMKVRSNDNMKVRPKDNMKVRPKVNKALLGGKGKGGHSHGRRGKSRH